MFHTIMPVRVSFGHEQLVIVVNNNLCEEEEEEEEEEEGALNLTTLSLWVDERLNTV